MCKVLNVNHVVLFRRCQGFSLVELMVALVITLILLAGIGQVYLSSKKSFTIQDTLGRQQENARYAVEIVAQDVRRASYWGGNADIDYISGTLGMVNEDGTCKTSDNSWGRMLDRPILGKNNTNAGYDCIPDSNYLGSDILVVRYQAPWQVPSQTTPSFEENRLYLRSALTAAGGALGRVFEGKDAGFVSNDMDHDLSTDPEPSERVAELISHAYYIGPSGSTCRGAPVPSLFRETLNKDGIPEAEEIASGVERFEVRYGVDSDGDRSVDEYRCAPGTNEDGCPATPVSASDWGNVIALQFWLLTRAECPETGYTNDTGYTMPGVASPFNDAYRRQLYTTVVKLRNR
jgi:type IV pilus assembly protein PilW